MPGTPAAHKFRAREKQRRDGGTGRSPIPGPSYHAIWPESAFGQFLKPDLSQITTKENTRMSTDAHTHTRVQTHVCTHPPTPIQLEGQRKHRNVNIRTHAHSRANARVHTPTHPHTIGGAEKYTERSRAHMPYTANFFNIVDSIQYGSQPSIKDAQDGGCYPNSLSLF